MAPDIPFEDGGLVGDVREAIIEAARRQILVVATAEPNGSGKV
jgi:hypothetical protein